MALVNGRKVSNRGIAPRRRLYPEALSTLGIRKDSQEMTWEDIRKGYNKAVNNNPNITPKEKRQNKRDLNTIVDMLEGYVKNFHTNFEEGSGFFLMGDNDNGKTTLTGVLAREAYVMRYDVKVITAEQISELSRDFDNPEAKEQLDDLIYKYDLLVVDEVGKETEGKNRYNQTILERILKARIETYELPTVVITNLSPEDFRERYGNSIYSVLRYLQPIIMTYSLYFRKPRRIVGGIL